MMTPHDINIVLQIACVTILAMAGILLLRHAKTGLNTWTGIGLVVAVICYLISSNHPENQKCNPRSDAIAKKVNQENTGPDVEEAFSFHMIS